MYKCFDCGKIFMRPKTYYEEYEHFGFPVEKKEEGCPNCAGSYEEAYKCKVCGAYSFGTICANDRKRITTSFRNYVTANFNEDETEALNDMWEDGTLWEGL